MSDLPDNLGLSALDDLKFLRTSQAGEYETIMHDLIGAAQRARLLLNRDIDRVRWALDQLSGFEAAIARGERLTFASCAVGGVPLNTVSAKPEGIRAVEALYRSDRPISEISFAISDWKARYFSAFNDLAALASLVRDERIRLETERDSFRQQLIDEQAQQRQNESTGFIASLAREVRKQIEADSVIG